MIQSHTRYPDELRNIELRDLAQKEVGAARDVLLSAGGEVSWRAHRRFALLHGHMLKHSAVAAQQRDSELSLATKALQQHAACARCSNEHDHASLFGMVGLWFE